MKLSVMTVVVITLTCSAANAEVLNHHGDTTGFTVGPLRFHAGSVTVEHAGRLDIFTKHFIIEASENMDEEYVKFVPVICSFYTADDKLVNGWNSTARGGAVYVLRGKLAAGEVSLLVPAGKVATWARCNID
ncbi:hypothetical protein IVB55_39450 [Bradyrhizobium sp. CW4]|uniref:hypothetical protein n=1 Tax=Bradyrhizobium sp. CW4 TaxID=2782687 RepID=UPI001FFB6809|nr:hypothetical protein [Bradyrhizobium sp. CW4]MCK1418903.1 hypothetical protein [Bradyrhizobium sp. CW4]